ncbi:replication initiation protein [Leuconostoc litchii]|uniref:Helicase DnaB n=1 Tax=Leuconostoc litchii TaxID=1981069 RepID=A0A6P2CQJ9_9LACO|nr:DnaD domain protein [Leuconostoc litchii]TYC47392.1 helicase DnaB [Leuconostoc litchii]GMA69405.1 replication initiation protein [Leuconostoc litchii]
MGSLDGTIEFHAKAGVFIQSNTPITLSDLTRTFDLYTPFIGATGYALYHMLVNELPYNTQLSAREDHNFILDSLNISLPDFVKVRRRLEAVGLLTTFHTTDALGEIYTYQLFAPLDVVSFFQEKLLAGLLFKYVGEERYLLLQQRYAVQGQPQIKGDNISAKFLQVFRHDATSNIPVSDIQKNQSKIELNSQFDFDSFSTLVRGTTAEKVAQHRDFLVSMHVIYGVDEITLAGYTSQAITLDTHDVDEKILQQIMRKTRAKKPIEAAPQQQLPQNLSNEMQKLIQSAKSLAPNAFIEDVKFKKGGGFVTRSEYYFISKMIKDVRLKPEVVNMLIWYELVKRNRDTVNVDTAETIANSWLKIQVNTAESALQAIEKYQPNHNRSSKREYQKKAVHVEPKMAVDAVQNDATKTTSVNEVAEALAELKKMNIKTKN